MTVPITSKLVKIHRRAAYVLCFSCGTYWDGSMMNGDMFSLTNRVAVVIGGGGVLAGAMASGLSEAGAAIAILDLSGEHAEARAMQIR